MEQEVGFVRSKKKTLSPDFFPAGKERQFAPTGEPSERRQPAAEHCEMPPPPAPPKEPAAASPERALEQKMRAFSLDGPVEAVGFQADSEFWQVFEDIETIGRGHFAKVKLVSHLHTGEHFAAKILDKNTADNDIEDLVREFQMLRSLRHPNIIRLFAAYETPRKLYLVTEVTNPAHLIPGRSSYRAALPPHCTARPPTGSTYRFPSTHPGAWSRASLPSCVAACIRVRVRVRVRVG